MIKKFPFYRKRSHRKHHSIFFKIFMVIIFFGCLIWCLFFGAFHYLFEHKSPLPLISNINYHVDHVMTVLGDPPKLEKANELSKILFVDFRYQNGHDSWATDPKIPLLNELKKRHRIKEGDYGWFKGNFFILKYPNKGTLIIYTNFKNNIDKRSSFFFYLLCIVVIVLSGIYLSIRKIMSPIKPLMRAVKKVGEGDFDHKVKVKTHDELGDLSHAFNEMTGSIKEMMESKKQLLLDVSHELRTPLTRMKLALEFIEDKKQKTNLASDIIELETMINEILEGERLSTENGKLNKELIEMDRLVLSLIDAEGPFEINLNNPQIKVNIDPKRMSTVINNLIENAIKYSQNKTNSLSIEIKSSMSSNHYELTIKDKGRGIPAKDLTHVFEPFYRVDPSRTRETGGYGLGLNLCKKIIEAHGGEITIDSQENQGTTVLLKIPLQEPS